MDIWSDFQFDYTLHNLNEFKDRIIQFASFKLDVSLRVAEIWCLLLICGLKWYSMRSVDDIFGILWSHTSNSFIIAVNKII